MPCSTCLFDAAAWTPSDLARTLLAVEPWFHQLAEGASDAVRAQLQPIAARLAELPRDAHAEVVHEAWRLLADAGRLRHAMGDGAPTAIGAVVQVSTPPAACPSWRCRRRRSPPAGSPATSRPTASTTAVRGRRSACGRRR